MKKIYTVNPWKKHADKRAREGVNKKRRNRGKSQQNAYIDRKEYYKQVGASLPKKSALKKGGRVVKAPSIFSLIRNVEETLAFFDQIWSLYGKHPIYVDLSEITEMTIESILYLISIFERLKYEKKEQYQEISGNYPRDEKCRELLCSSGFTEYIKTSSKNHHQSDDVLKIIRGENVDAAKIAEIGKFIIKKLQLPGQSSGTRGVQTVLMECAGNTLEHSHKGENSLYRNKWWGMAHYDKNKGVTCSILDNGVGIVSTMRKGHMETIKKFFADLGINKIYDNELLFKAFTEPNRSSLELDFRGNGLPKIYELAQSPYLRNMFVVSNKAFINLSNSDCNVELRGKLKGTLYSFEFSSTMIPMNN